MKLNSKQKNFCNEYIKNGANGTQAYLKAYKTKSEETATVNASRLLRNANVQQYISELQEEAKDKAIMSAIERKKWLTDVVKDIQREECMVKMPDGEEMVIGSKNADLNTKLKAIDILNKMDGEYKTILDGKVEVKKKLEDVL